MAFILPDAAKRDIKGLLSKINKLDEVMAASRDLTPDISPAPLFEKVASKSGLSLPDVRAIFQALENFQTLKAKIKPPETVFGEVSKLLDDETRSSWLQAESALVGAIDSYDADSPVSLSIKANRLAFSFERVGSDFEIFTDARPVFNSSGDRIIEYVITHTLLVSSFRNRQTDRTQFSLDGADLADLRTACERAILKAKTLNSALMDGKIPSKGLNDDVK